MVKTTKVCKKDIKMNAQVMYLRLLAINAMKKVPIVPVLSYENSPIPLSLFTEDGSMIIPNKLQFMHKLESITGEKITNVNGVDTIIFDAHAIIQMLQVRQNNTTVNFKDMALKFMNYIMHVEDQGPRDMASLKAMSSM